MRKIKFRGKSLSNKEWEQGSLVICNNGRQFITELFEVDEDSWLYWEIDPATVGQFVGLTDKNGKEIYEGDIVRSDEYPFSDLEDNERDNYMGIVFCVTREDDSIGEFQVMQFVTKKSTKRGISNFINKSFYEINMENLEVVGNIFDNKGLFRNSDDEILQWYKDE